MSDLKPCPFCGRRPFATLNDQGPNCVDRYSAKLECLSCKVRMISFDDDMDAAVKSVATAWNTRAHTPESGHEAAVEALHDARKLILAMDTKAPEDVTYNLAVLRAVGKISDLIRARQ